MGRIENKKFMIKPSCKNQKFTCAHIFWDFMLNQVRQGLMTYESLMASVTGLSPCNEACGTGGGSGGKAIYGYTGTSPPETNKQLWYKSFLSIAATFLLGFMLVFVACEDTKIENDRIAELLLKGENVKSSDFKTAEKNLEDGDILHAVSDGKFHWTPKEYSAAEIAWLVKKLKELESTGKGVIQGKNYINPRDFTPEDSTYLANLGFQVYRYGDDDPCELERDAVTTGAQDSCAWTWYTRERLDSALTVPNDWVEGLYLSAFSSDNIPRETFLDSVYRHIDLIDQQCRGPDGTIWPVLNSENMQIFYDACTVYVNQVIPDMGEKRAALKECEDENSGINFPQMKSATFQMQNRDGILDGRRRLLKTVVSD
ncbi:MAG: hypothetical protein FWH18_11690 [Marinilabiliaceae bacterium]|nr:hypothetical protein [Marinilabiliaceae bacterium]